MQSWNLQLNERNSYTKPEEHQRSSDFGNLRQKHMMRGVSWLYFIQFYFDFYAFHNHLQREYHPHIILFAEQNTFHAGHHSASNAYFRPRSEIRMGLNLSLPQALLQAMNIGFRH